AGSQSLTATDKSTASITGSQKSITINAAATSRLAVSAPASVTSGTAFNVTVRAVDAYGNTATGYTGAVHFTTTAPKPALPAASAFPSTDAGSHTFSVILQTLATQSLTVADKSNKSVASGSASLMVNLAAPFNLTVTAVSARQIFLTWQNNSTNE